MHEFFCRRATRVIYRQADFGAAYILVFPRDDREVKEERMFLSKAAEQNVLSDASGDYHQLVLSAQAKWYVEQNGRYENDGGRRRVSRARETIVISPSKPPPSERWCHGVHGRRDCSTRTAALSRGFICFVTVAAFAQSGNVKL